MPAADLSVVVPNFNHAHLLPRALDAVLGQSVRAREVIVVDDASTDGSVAVAEAYARRDASVKVVRRERNGGVMAAVNDGVARSSGQYLFVTAADDYVLPGCFEKAVEAIDAHPHAGLVFGYFTTADEAGVVSENPSGWCDRPTYFAPAEVAARAGRGGIPGHATVVRRGPFERVGGYRPELAWYSDWFAFTAVAFRHGVVHVPEPLAVLTVSAGSYSADPKASARHPEVVRAVLDRLLSPEFADVADLFRAAGSLWNLGPDLIRAAAGRPDCWTPRVLGLLNAVPGGVCESLAGDPDPAVRELAAAVRDPFWREHEARAADLKRITAALEDAAKLQHETWRETVELRAQLAAADARLEREVAMARGHADNLAAELAALRAAPLHRVIARKLNGLTGRFKTRAAG